MLNILFFFGFPRLRRTIKKHSMKLSAVHIFQQGKKVRSFLEQHLAFSFRFLLRFSDFADVSCLISRTAPRFPLFLRGAKKVHSRNRYSVVLIYRRISCPSMQKSIFFPAFHYLHSTSGSCPEYAIKYVVLWLLSLKYANIFS